MLKGLQNKMSGKLQFLSDEDCEKIHYASLEVLRDVGLKIESRYALDALEGMGCDVSKRTSIVKFPNYLVEDCLRACPHSVKLYGLDSKYNINVEKKRTYVSTGSGYGVIDEKNNMARAGTLKDVRDATLIAHHLDNIHSIVPPMMGVSDIPSNIATPTIVSETLKYTNKTIEFYLTGAPESKNEVDSLISLCELVAGGPANLKRRPFAMLAFDPSSPLAYLEDHIMSMFKCIDAGIPVTIMPGVVGGATAPITISGILVQSNAEFLGGVVLANIAQKGASVLYGHYNSIMNMQTGNYSAGSVEMGIIGSCVAQLGNWYGIPTNGFFPMSDSHIPDQQVGYEKMMQWTLSTLGGMNYLSGAGNVENGTMISLEQLVIDNEVVGMVDRMLKGVQVDDERIGMDTISKVGPGGSYFKQTHTLKWSGDECFSPRISEKESFSSWSGENVITKAKAEVDVILHDVETPVHKDIIKDIEIFQKGLR
ncbi:trimethylamine methyltransferase family protein [Methanococcoides sp. AM1]|uniref:trimethylamine methyltransferase family protein n=1 Tax=Methanococcoides sp. AM1 TaxID=1201011 RepID=UPI0010841145|nr:trimethylamine methyltransferase family protein [Methanococcoides sp. AM1]